MANIWNRYKEASDGFIRYMARYSEYLSYKRQNKDDRVGLFKTETKHEYIIDLDGLDGPSLSVYAKGNRIVAMIIQIDFKRLIFELLASRVFSYIEGSN